MSKITWIFILTIFWITTYSQTDHPGGVAGVKVWLKVKSDNPSSGQVIDAKNEEFLAEGPLTLMNHQPGILWSDETDLQLELNQFQGSNLTIFTVYQLTSIEEECIFSMDSKDNHQLLLTSHRMADLNALNYMNFPHVETRIPQVNTYIHSQQNYRATEIPEILRIGKKPMYNKIPVDGFEGVFYEMIIYDRTLSPQEKHQLESYLAIKYGLTLRNAIGAYTDMNGQPLWPFIEYPDMDDHITVIGYDGNNAFAQASSTSTELEGFLNLTYSSKEETPEIGYTSMLSNDLSMVLDQGTMDGVYEMSRTWIVYPYGENKATDLSWDVGALTSNLQDNYWMKVYRKGKENLDLQHQDFYPARISNDRHYIREILWDGDGSGSDAFTLIEAPELFVIIDDRQASCSDDEDLLPIKIIGGRAPYKVEVYDGDDILVKSLTLNDGSVSSLKGLSQGLWNLKVTDNLGSVYKTSFFRQGFIPEINDIPVTEYIVEGSTLTLDAGGKSGRYNYRWFYEGNHIASSTQVVVSKPGKYMLEIEYDGCKYWHTMHIKNTSSYLFEKVQVFPNPTLDGYFQAEVDLKKESPIWMTISDLQGKVIQEKYLPTNYIHFIHGHIAMPGLYLLSFRSEEEVITKKVVVK